MSKLVPCPHCGERIPKDAIDCVYCRREVADALSKIVEAQLAATLTKPGVVKTKTGERELVGF